MFDMQSCQTYYVQHKVPVVISPHTHDHHELVYFITGDGSTKISQQRFPYHANHFSFCSAGTIHDEVDPNDCEILLAAFLFEAPSIHLEEGVFPDSNNELLHLMWKLRRLSLTPSPYQSVLLESCLADILVRVAMIQNPQTDLAPANEDNHRINWDKVIETIDAQFHNEVDFYQIAASHHYSYSRFRQLFTQHFSAAPHEYLTLRRLEHAILLLKQTNLTITEIAYQSGFNSSSTFSTAFMKHYALPPKEYRKRNRGF